MDSNYGEINEVLCFNYLSRLIDKLFKILPLKETHSENIVTYIEDLIYELLGCKSILVESDLNPKIFDIVCILESIKSEDMSHAEYRRLVFKCITITKQLREHIMNEVNWCEG